MPQSRGSSRPRDRTCNSCVSCTAGSLFTTSFTWEAREQGSCQKEERPENVGDKSPSNLQHHLNTKYLLSSILGYMPGTRRAHQLPSLISSCVPCTLD